jgi:methyl-accepting chemotaxis protein
MDGVTQQNAALVEQASAAAQTLTDQAANLTELISRYRLDGTRPVAAAAPAAGPAPAAVRAVKAPAVERRGANRPFSRPGKREAPGAGQAGAAKLASRGEETWQEF